jgi:uncharacterized protein (TIGR02246 family)
MAGKGRLVTHADGRSILFLIGFLLWFPAGAGLADTRDDTKSVEEAVLAVSAEMTRAGEAADADRLFSYMLDTDRGSVIQNGVVLATRQEALERVRSNLRGIRKIQYHWKRQYVTVLSPQVALLTAEGASVVSTTAGDTFTAPFAQTVVFVLRAGEWKAIHAHQSSPRVP